MRHLLVVTLFLAACAHSQRPFVFSAPAGDIRPSVSRTLAADGLTPEWVTSGEVRTRWIDTGYHDRVLEPQDDNLGTVVLRYVATVQPGPLGQQVTLRAETQRCEMNHFVILRSRIDGHCKPLDSLSPSLQAKLDTLGEKLKSTLVPGGPSQRGR